MLLIFQLSLCNISNTKSNTVYNDHPYGKCQCQASVANVCTQVTDTSQANGNIHKIANDNVGTSKRVFDQCIQLNDEREVHATDDHQLQGAESVGAMKTVQFCSTAQNVGTVNIIWFMQFTATNTFCLYHTYHAIS